MYLLHYILGRITIENRDVPKFRRVVTIYLKDFNLVILISMLKITCRCFVLCKVASKTKHFIHADILVLVSEFVVVVGADYC